MGEESCKPKDSDKNERLPNIWYVILISALGIGILISYFNPGLPFLFNKVTTIIHPDKWSRLFGMYLMFMSASHFIVYASLLKTKKLFDLKGKYERKNLWPPALLGVCESIMYPTALLYGEGKFIGFWILIKVAGNWPRWGLKTDHVKEGEDIVEVLQEGRRRYFQFLIGSSLMILLSFIFYGMLKMTVILRLTTG